MDQLTDFFKVLSDETRLRILVLLAQKELCVCEICGVLEVSQPKASKHLAKLRDMGFVKDERKEQFIFYSLNIKDKVASDLIKNIIDNINVYPSFSVDKERLADIEIYLNQCKIDKGISK